MEMKYENLQDIPQFPHANYQVNVPWGLEDGFFGNCEHVNLDPDYQRGYVWTQEQKERYIEYRLQGGLSGHNLYFNCPNWNRSQGNTIWHNTLEMVDGKQRLSAMREFMSDRVRAFGKLKSEYTDHERGIRRVGRVDFVFCVNNLATKREVVEWYLGMNNGGTVHTEKDLDVAKAVLKSLEG